MCYELRRLHISVYYIAKVVSAALLALCLGLLTPTLIV